MPNPSSGFIRVDLPGRRGETITGTLYTPDGSLVERLDLVLGDPFPLSVPSGVYVLILGAPGTSAYQRAVLVVVRS